MQETRGHHINRDSKEKKFNKIRLRIVCWGKKENLAQPPTFLPPPPKKKERKKKSHDDEEKYLGEKIYECVCV